MDVSFLRVLIFPAALLVTFTSIWLLLSHHWRTSLLALALQYLGVFALVAYSWPLEMAAVKLVAGWMSSAILGAAIAGVPTAWQDEARFLPSGRLFRLLLAILAGLAIWALAPQLESWLPAANVIHIWGGLTLIGMGLLHLGLTTQPLRVMIGLLTVLAGFEVLYAAVESSTLVAALLASVNLGLALVGSYLLTVSVTEDIA